ncbi:MAG: hypothetical protein NTX04_05350, partial [Verrucomicrobia bacterium]|nr:hypothetical protein [Verrucomicrobiota bacterium]
MPKLPAILLAIAFCSPQISPLSAADSPPVKPSKHEESANHQKSAADFFAGPILRFKIAITPEQLAKLRKDERHYAEGTITEITAAG